MPKSEYAHSWWSPNRLYLRKHLKPLRNLFCEKLNSISVTAVSWNVFKNLWDVVVLNGLPMFCPRSLTVLPSHCHCGMFLRVTWRVDFTGDLAELEELANQRSGGWLWRRIQAWTGDTRGNLFDWLEKLLQKQSKMLPLHMAAIHKL